MPCQSARKICRLTDLPLNTEATVAKLKIDELEINRLHQLGLHCGSTIKIIHGAENESILIAISDARVAVNYEIAANIYVF